MKTKIKGLEKNKILDTSWDWSSLDWLELQDVPERVYNPFLDYPIGGIPDDPVEEMLGMLMNPDYLHFACKAMLNMELLPFQCLILEKMWNKRLPMVIASRGGGKSTLLSIYALLRMIFHPGCKVVIVGAAFRQSKNVHEYMVNIWDKAPILRDIAGPKGGPKRETDRCEFRIGDSVCYALPLGDGSKIRGLRANYILADEFASIPEEIFNVVVQGFGAVSAEPVDKVKDAALRERLKKEGLWNEQMETISKKKMGGNQIIYTGTAYYSFNHFYRYFDKWHRIISSKGDPAKLAAIFDGQDTEALKGFDWRDYCILRVPYTHLPEGLLDSGILAQAKATLHNSQFLMEYGAVFASDSDGFYKRSLIDTITTNKPVMTPSGKIVQFSAARYGDEKRTYVMGIDPAADADNAAITVLEQHDDHRRVVFCWTTNKKRFQKLKDHMRSSGMSMDLDYYRYIAKKIRDLMSVFNIEHIMMDKHGGGTAIAEALASKDTVTPQHPFPVFEIIDPDKPKMTDAEEGYHILELVVPTTELNSEANHGMLKDMQDHALLFPMFDTVEMAKAVELDNINNIQFDTYEQLVEDIEELKNEMCTIEMSATSVLGQERFDTPEVKMDGQKKGRLRKDRYSALLYANYYSRNKDKDNGTVLQYKAVGGTRDTIGRSENKSENMYRGFGTAKFGKSSWAKTGNPRFIKRDN